MPAYKSSTTDKVWSLYGGRLLVFAPATVEISPAPNDSAPLPVAVTLQVDIVDGRLACTELTAKRIADGPTINSEVIRSIAVSRLVADAAEEANIVIEPDKDGRYNFLGGGFSWPPMDFAASGPTDEALDHAARVYAFCMASGLNPNSELHKRYGISKATTSRWIATARRRGILSDEHQGPQHER